MRVSISIRSLRICSEPLAQKRELARSCLAPLFSCGSTGYAYRMMSSLSCRVLRAVLGLGLLTCLGCSSRVPVAEGTGAANAQQIASSAGSSTAGLSTENLHSTKQLDSRIEAMLQELEHEPPVTAAPDPEDPGLCPPKGKRNANIGLLITPDRPTTSDQIRVVVSTFLRSTPYAIRIKDRKGKEVSLIRDFRSGFPATTVAHLPKNLSAGIYAVEIGHQGVIARCAKIRVGIGSRDGRKQPAYFDKTWPVKRKWNDAEEALYSAWVRELFHADVEQDLAFRALHEVTSVRERNLLHDYLGMIEDSPKSGLSLSPDCADTPYFLRAYYSWKRRLPFVFRSCNRGRVGKAPQCSNQRSNLDPPELKSGWKAPEESKTEQTRNGKRGLAAEKPSKAEQNSSLKKQTLAIQAASDEEEQAEVPKAMSLIQYFFRKTLGWGVHTGNGRVALKDEQSDLYPINMSRRSIRPGTVYADPYGHILVVSEFVAPRGGVPGILFAVDGQPDASITRKRFWEGNFLWNPDPGLGGSGFKNFRPAVVVDENGQRQVLTMSNDEIAKHRDYADFSVAAQGLEAPQFYDAMEELITPGIRNPFWVQKAAIEALAEAVRIRVTSVDNGVEWHKKNPKKIIEMPEGHSVFETSGPWEDYSTPARDLRLLIAIDIVLGFAKKVERNARIFQLEDETLRRQVLKLLEDEQQKYLQDTKYSIRYTRSDGSSFSLTLAQVTSRLSEFEMAYNPNDCPEVRWGAKEGTEEFQPCDRRAPGFHHRKMMAYRSWFRERKRPARGDPGPTVQP